MDLEIGTWAVPTCPIPVLPAEGASQSRGREAGGDVNVAGTRGGGGGACPPCLVCGDLSCDGCLSATEYDTQWSDGYQPKRKSCQLCRKVFFNLFILSIIFFIGLRVYMYTGTGVTSVLNTAAVLRHVTQRLEQERGRRKIGCFCVYIYLSM